MIPLLQAILLGIVEGITEFLPISSTGHLIVAEHLIGFKDTAKLFTVVIQMGAIVAVLWFYRHDLTKRIGDFLKHPGQTKQFWLNLIIATIPAGIAGLLLDKATERISVPLTVAIAMILGGIVLWYVDAAKPTEHRQMLRLDDISPRQALQIGFAQAVALIPGVSRSGASIVGGMASGLNRVTATAFSFYAGLPILAMAGGYKLIKDRDQLSTLPGGASSLVVGTVVSAIVAFMAVTWLLRYIASHNFRGFAIYRILAGSVLLVLIATTSL